MCYEMHGYQKQMQLRLLSHEGVLQTVLWSITSRVLYGVHHACDM